ncbi:MAG: ATPase [Alphaproteobacteria bacterium]|nr:ATPase [Alphaproteobacteria bacterium]
MSASAQDAKAALARKSDAATRRFVAALVRAGSATRSADAYVAGEGGGQKSLALDTVRTLAADGLVRIENNACRPTAETTAWLRRRLSAPADFAAQHRLIAPGPEGTTRDLAHDVLEKLARPAAGGFLQPHQLEAGRKVAMWGARAQLRQRVTMSYDPAQIGGRRGGAAGADLADMAAEARKALARLFRDLPRDCAEVIFDVCVFEKGLQAIETERGWPRRSAKLVLRIGLDRLAEALGLMPEATGWPTSRHHDWRDESFGPTRFE